MCCITSFGIFEPELSKLLQAKFDLKSAESCVKGYFRGFAEKIKYKQQEQRQQHIPRNAEGLVLQHHGFATVEVFI